MLFFKHLIIKNFYSNDEDNEYADCQNSVEIKAFYVDFVVFVYMRDIFFFVHNNFLLVILEMNRVL